MKTSCPKMLWAFLCTLIPFSAQADNWADYVNLRSHYYSFDLSTFKTITCRVDQPLLTEQMNRYLNVQSQGKAWTTVTDYILTIDHTGDIKIVEPELKFTPPDSLSADDAKSLYGLAQSYLKKIVAGPKGNLVGLMNDYMPPDSKDDVIYTISDRGDGVSVSGKSLDTGMTWSVVYSGPEAVATAAEDLKLEQGVVHVTGTVKNHYKRVDGKYLVQSMEQDSMFGASHNYVDTAVTYQSVSGITLPKTVTWQSVLENGKKVMDSMEFKGCEIVK